MDRHPDIESPIYLSRVIRELWLKWKHRKVKLNLPTGEDWRVIDRNEVTLTRREQILFDEIVGK